MSADDASWNRALVDRLFAVGGDVQGVPDCSRSTRN